MRKRGFIRAPEGGRSLEMFTFELIEEAILTEGRPVPGTRAPRPITVEGRRETFEGITMPISEDAVSYVAGLKATVLITTDSALAYHLPPLEYAPAQAGERDPQAYRLSGSRVIPAVIENVARASAPR